MDTQLACMMSESSVDYIARFNDLAQELAVTEPSIPPPWGHETLSSPPGACQTVLSILRRKTDPPSQSHPCSGFWKCNNHGELVRSLKQVYFTELFFKVKHPLKKNTFEKKCVHKTQPHVQKYPTPYLNKIFCDLLSLPLLCVCLGRAGSATPAVRFSGDTQGKHGLGKQPVHHPRLDPDLTF